MKKFLKYFSTIMAYSILIVLIIIGIIFLIYIIDYKKQQGDSKPLYNAYSIISGSMEPKISVYDVVVSKKTDASKLEKGDVITFLSNDSNFYGAVVTHRIVEVIDSSKGIYRTQGDANNVSDEALTSGDRIIGKVVITIPQLGRVQSIVATKMGWFIVVLIPCLAIISYDIVKLINLTGKKAKQKINKNKKV